MPYKNFGADPLLADDVNNYLMRQSIIRVANSAELAAIPTPVAGMMAYRTDDATTYRHDGTTWVSMHIDSGDLAVPATTAYDAGSSIVARRLGHLIAINGTAIRDSGNVAVSDNLAVLPPAVTPSASRNHIVPGVGTSTVKVQIQTDGDIAVTGVTGTTTTAYLDLLIRA